MGSAVRDKAIFIKVRSKKRRPSRSIEWAYEGHVAGIDEAGCAPLAGPVVAAAVIFDRTPRNIPYGLDDSKKLDRATRERLFERIQNRAIAFGVGQASVAEIDQLNIHGARMLAMRRAVEALDPGPDICLVDGNCDPKFGIPTQCVIKGDGLCSSIAAASILAKVSRDRIMADLAKDYPHYGWERNAGYGVPAHLEALKLVGVTPHHRRNFNRVREILMQQREPAD